ncbi:MAG: hypothetical protein QME64_07945, partial [bacterium]|nr:hypothetical protein [bacterium]
MKSIIFLLPLIAILAICYSNNFAQDIQASNIVCSVFEEDIVGKPETFRQVSSLKEQILITPPSGPALHSPDTVWVENTLASMNLDEKIGQMIIVWYSSVGSGYSQISNYHVGGFIFS